MAGSKFLNITHLDEVEEVLVANCFPKTKWLPLGLKLGLYKTTLDSIKAENQGDVGSCLLECLSAWLSKADNVISKGGPNWILLTSSLRGIDEVAVADNVDQQKQPAYFILYQHHAALSQNLTDPIVISVARLLQRENLVTEEYVTSIERRPSLPEKRKALLSSVQDAVSTDYHNLLIFGNALQKVIGNVSLVKDILNDKAFADMSNDMHVMKSITTEDTQVPNAPTNGKKIFVPRSMSKEFTAMRAKFGRTFLKMQDVIEKYPVCIDRLKTFLEYSYPDLTSQLSVSKCAKDVLSLAQEKCSLIDIKLLEEMTEEFELKEAEKHIKTYKEEIEKFCQTMSVRLCLNETFQVNVPHTPLQCETITFVVEGNPDDYVLDDIRNLLSATFESLSLTVKVVVIKEGNSFIIKCCFPVQLAMLLIAKAFDNLETLKQRFGLLSLTIGYVTVWNKQNRDEELIKLTKRLETEIDNKAKMSTTIIEKEKEIQKLKKMLSDKEVVSKENKASMTTDSTPMSLDKQVTVEIQKYSILQKMMEKIKKTFKSTSSKNPQHLHTSDVDLTASKPYPHHHHHSYHSLSHDEQSSYGYHSLSHDEQSSCGYHSCSAHSCSTHSHSTSIHDLPARYGYPDLPAHYGYPLLSHSRPQTLDIGSIPEVYVQAPTPTISPTGTPPRSPIGTPPCSPIGTPPCSPTVPHYYDRDRPRTLPIKERKEPPLDMTNDDNIMLTTMLYLQHPSCNKKNCATCNMIKKKFDEIAEKYGNKDILDTVVTPGTETHKQLMRRKPKSPRSRPLHVIPELKHWQTEYELTTTEDESFFEKPRHIRHKKVSFNDDKPAARSPSPISIIPYAPKDATVSTNSPTTSTTIIKQDTNSSYSIEIPSLSFASASSGYDTSSSSDYKIRAPKRISKNTQINPTSPQHKATSNIPYVNAPTQGKPHVQTLDNISIHSTQSDTHGSNCSNSSNSSIHTERTSDFHTSQELRPILFMLPSASSSATTL